MPATCSCCGEELTDAPTDLAPDLPDVIFALGRTERAARAEVTPGGDLCLLDRGKARRCFFRCVLGLPLEGGHEFRYGVWVEVPSADVQRVVSAWDQPRLYRSLRFEGRLGTSLLVFPDSKPTPLTPSSLDAEVTCAVVDPEHRPRVVASSHEAVAALLRDGWDGPAYHGFVRAYGWVPPRLDA